MNMNLKPSHLAAIVGVYDPDANTAGGTTFPATYVDMADFGSLMAIIMAGDLGSSATINAKLVQATSAAGAGSKDIPGKAITALTAGGTDSNKQAVINLHEAELDVAGGFRFVACTITVGVSTSDSAGLLIGMHPKKNIASEYDIAAVKQIV